VSIGVMILGVLVIWWKRVKVEEKTYSLTSSP
jgi:hypothetical protein